MDAQCLHVGGEPSQADVKLIMDAKHLLKICAERLSLHAKATVGSDGDAVIADHGNHGSAIVLGDALK